MLMKTEPLLTLIDETIIIDRPIEQVFAFVANHENYALWFPGVISITSEASVPHATVGKVYSEIIRLPTGHKRHIRIPVVQSNPPFQIATEGEFAPLHPRMEFRLDPLDDTQTELRWLFTSRTTSLIGRFVVRLLAGRIMAANAGVARQRLKACLEQD